MQLPAVICKELSLISHSQCIVGTVEHAIKEKAPRPLGIVPGQFYLSRSVSLSLLYSKARTVIHEVN